MQHSGPGLDYDSPTILPFDFTVTGSDLLSSTCHYGNAFPVDCATYVIAEIPAFIQDTVQPWKVSLSDYGQTAVHADYGERYARMEEFNLTQPDPARGTPFLSVFSFDACGIGITGQPGLTAYACSHADKVNRCLALLNQ